MNPLIPYWERKLKEAMVQKRTTAKEEALKHITKALLTLLSPEDGTNCEYEIIQDLAIVAKHLQARIK